MINKVRSYLRREYTEFNQFLLEQYGYYSISEWASRQTILFWPAAVMLGVIGVMGGLGMATCLLGR